MKNEDYFKQFNNLKPVGMELNVVESDGPELIVATYEILDFIRLNEADDLGKYNDLQKQLKNSKDQCKRDSLRSKISQLTVREHKLPSSKVKLYDALMYVEELGGPSDYECDECNEDEISRCMQSLCQRLCEDMEGDEINPDKIKEIAIFSGLHGRSSPAVFANRIVCNVGEKTKVIVYNTGGGTGTLDTRVKSIRAEREDICKLIRPYLEMPYVDCIWNHEQGMGGL